MDIDQLANCLEKLGNSTRLAIFRQLVKAGHDGLSVGELRSRLDIPPSTLSHHILFLVTVQLVRQERQGRTLQCKPNLPLMREIVAELTAECCRGASAPVTRKRIEKPAARAKRLVQA
jgi:ArsR family transcriptional regulator, arsenate/arsenite/antimonite-responsive transcriptional repressor